MILTADLGLARRLEGEDALNGLECVEAVQRLWPEMGATSLAVAGGQALYCGPVSPLTHALAVGLNGAVTAEDVYRIEEFFRMRGAAVAIDLNPLADDSLRRLLVERGYRVSEFHTVLARLLHPWETLPWCGGPRVRLATEGEDRAWATRLAEGFFEHDGATEEEVQIGLALFHMVSSQCYVAEVDGVAVGGGALAMRGTAASLFGDATLPQFRGRRVQTALIQARLAAAIQAGCTIAMAGTLPGSISQRNYERYGFRVAYTKLVMTKE